MTRRKSPTAILVCWCVITIGGIALIYYPVLRQMGVETGRGGHGHGATSLLLIVLPFLVAIAGTVCLVQAYLMNVDADPRRGCVQGIIGVAGVLLLLLSVAIVGFFWLVGRFGDV